MRAKDIGIRILSLCEERGWTLYRLKETSGVNYNTLRSICYGNSSPLMDTLERICQGFNISLSDFFNEKEKVRKSLSDEQMELIKITDFLDPGQMRQVIAYSKGIKEK